jgi:hypothetical protein
MDCRQRRSHVKPALQAVLRRRPGRTFSGSQPRIASGALERVVANVVTHLGQLGYETGYVLGK